MPENLHIENAKGILDLVIQDANVLTNTMFERMQGKYWASIYLDENGNKKSPDLIQVDDNEFYIRYRIMPAMLCCTMGTISISGAEVDWKDYGVFKGLPPELFLPWRNKVSYINPYLFGITDAQSPDEKEKKI